MKLAAAILVGIVFSFASFAADTLAAIRVRAGQFNLTNVVVSVELPPELRQSQQLRGLDGKAIPLQVDKDGTGWFIISGLAKNQLGQYEIIAGGTATDDRAVLQKEGKRLKGAVAGKPVLWYQGEPGDLPRTNIAPEFRRGGYIHPLLTLSGRAVTDDYPPNHIHHHGVWWAWTKTEFQGREPDFWNMGQKKGRGEFVGIDHTWSGPVHSGFKARHRFVDLTAPTPVTALNDEWEVRIYPATADDKLWMFDLVSTQTTATEAPLKLPEYHYGGLGFRGNWAWNGKDKCFFLTSEGETDREKGNFTRGRWCAIWGNVDGQPAGVTILGSPQNFGAPQPMRLHPSEPFFCYAPQQLGPMEIVPGKPYVSRYRFLVHDGPPDKELIEHFWQEFADPPRVEVIPR